MAEFFRMPAATPTMEVGRLSRWVCAEGAQLSFGTVIAEVETDKNVAEIEVFDDGVLLKILVEADKDVPVGTPIAIVGSAGEDISALLASASSTATASTAPTTPTTTHAPPPTPQVSTETSSTSVGMAGPAARVKAEEAGVALQSVKGSGPHGRVMSGDIAKPTANSKTSENAGVVSYAWQNKTVHGSIMEMPVQFTPAGNYPKRRTTASVTTATSSTDSSANTKQDKTISNSMMRKTIANRLKQSYLDAPTFFLNAKFNCDNLVACRTQLKEAGNSVSYNDLVIKAVAKALEAVPGVNASWTEDAIIQHGRVDVGMAVALPEGLITPVIRNANTKGLVALSAETKSLVQKAKDRKLQTEEYTNSTFTISNLGMMQIEHFTAIINPPNAAILAIGSMQEEAVVVNGQLSVGWRMKVTMTCDHRVIDGALGAEFLQALRKFIEFPALLAG